MGSTEFTFFYIRENAFLLSVATIFLSILAFAHARLYENGQDFMKMKARDAFVDICQIKQCFWYHMLHTIFVEMLKK